MVQRTPESSQQTKAPTVRARDLMTPGVVALPIASRVPVALAAIAAHRVHAVLVLGFEGKPEAWLSAEALDSLDNPDRSLVWAVQAVGERVTRIDPFAESASARVALRRPGVHRLAVQERPEWLPEGVITDLDLAATTGAHN